MNVRRKELLNVAGLSAVVLLFASICDVLLCFNLFVVPLLVTAIYRRQSIRLRHNPAGIVLTFIIVVCLLWGAFPLLLMYDARWWPPFKWMVLVRMGPLVVLIAAYLFFGWKALPSLGVGTPRIRYREIWMDVYIIEVIGAHDRLWLLGCREQGFRPILDLHFEGLNLEFVPDGPTWSARLADAPS